MERTIEIMSKADFSGPRNWFLAATDLIARLGQKGDRGLDQTRNTLRRREVSISRDTILNTLAHKFEISIIYPWYSAGMIRDKSKTKR